MRSKVAILPLLVVSSLLACGSPTAPTTQLDGTWQTLPIPSGAYLRLSLHASADTVLGTGEEYGLQSRFLGSWEISGRQSVAGAFRLRLRSDDGRRATYAGTIVNSVELRGEWTPAGAPPYALTFTRQ